MIKSFSQKVQAVAAAIPKGRVATYGQVAVLAGHPKAARAVGSCMRKNDNPWKVPCHRVVAANGGLAGYAFGRGVFTKRIRLIKEGVRFKGCRVDMAACQWHPGPAAARRNKKTRVKK